MRMAERWAALRKDGLASMSEVRYEDGRVSVIPRSGLPA